MGWQQLVWRSQRRALPPLQSPQTDLHQIQSGASAEREKVESLGEKREEEKRRQVRGEILKREKELREEIEEKMVHFMLLISKYLVAMV